jgi:uncharacterized membrane protein
MVMMKVMVIIMMIMMMIMVIIDMGSTYSTKNHYHSKEGDRVRRIGIQITTDDYNV